MEAAEITYEVEERVDLQYKTKSELVHLEEEAKDLQTDLAVETKDGTSKHPSRCDDFTGCGL